MVVMDIAKLGYFSLAERRETRPSVLQQPLAGN
jgi:hypothetical protein